MNQISRPVKNLVHEMPPDFTGGIRRDESTPSPIQPISTAAPWPKHDLPSRQMDGMYGKAMRLSVLELAHARSLDAKARGWP